MKRLLLNKLHFLEKIYLNPASKKDEIKKIDDYEYPSRDDIENLFSKLLQKEKNIICQYNNVNLRRNLMIRILETYHNHEFDYQEARIKLNDRDTEGHFLEHWNYLEEYNFIEKQKNGKYRFCKRVLKWKYFGQV